MPSIIGGNLEIYHGVSITYHEIAMAVVSVLLMGGLGLFLAHTRWGFAIRAVAQDLTAARSLGVPVNRLYPMTMGLASAACRRRRRVSRGALLRLSDGG